jgi:hypothetical protein
MCVLDSPPSAQLLQFPCQHPSDEAEFHLFWPVFDKMIAGVEEVETLFECVRRLMSTLLPPDVHLSSAYIHQFFMFGAGQFIDEAYLAEYSNKVVGGIWTEALKRKFVHCRSLFY